MISIGPGLSWLDYTVCIVLAIACLLNLANGRLVQSPASTLKKAGYRLVAAGLAVLVARSVYSLWTWGDIFVSPYTIAGLVLWALGSSLISLDFLVSSPATRDKIKAPESIRCRSSCE